MKDWHTGPPPIGVEIELVTHAGKTLTGQVSFVAAHRMDGGKVLLQHMLRAGTHPIFTVERWRRVEN